LEEWEGPPFPSSPSTSPPGPTAWSSSRMMPSEGPNPRSPGQSTAVVRSPAAPSRGGREMDSGGFATQALRRALARFHPRIRPSPWNLRGHGPPWKPGLGRPRRRSFDLRRMPRGATVNNGDAFNRGDFLDLLHVWFASHAATLVTVA